MKNLMSIKKIMKIMSHIIPKEVIALIPKKKSTGDHMRELTDTKRLMKMVSYPSL